MSGTTNVDSKNYEIDMFLPVIGKDGKVEMRQENSVKKCKNARDRENKGVVIIPAYDGGKSTKTKEAVQQDEQEK